MTSAITLHPDVVTYLHAKIEATKAAKPEEQIVGLWVEVTKKGCSGNAYHFDVMTAARLAGFDGKSRFAQPERVDQDGVSVYIEPQSVLKLIGAQLVLVKDGFSTRLDFRNPNASDSCGCGESFTITPPDKKAEH